MKNPLAAARTPNDLYPTPPCAAQAIGTWLLEHHPRAVRHEPWGDWSGGFGTLLEWAGIPRARRHAMDVADDESPDQVAELRRRVPTDQLWLGCDALGQPWPSMHTLQNPPFIWLEQFIWKALRGNAPIVALLTPATFWHAKTRLALPGPDWYLDLTWRPNFSAGLKPDGTEGSSPFQEYRWVVYDGSEPRTVVERLVEPDVAPELVQEHRRLARMALGLEAER